MKTLVLLAMVSSFASRARPAKASSSDKVLPWTVALRVHWGAKKNREIYRAGLEHALLAALLDRACFKGVQAEPSDLLLDLTIDEFRTEQVYQTSGSMIPGQGDEHILRSARAGVSLEYSLRIPGSTEREVVSGHLHREAAREPQNPQDSPETRASNDLMDDAARWVAREVCDKPAKLEEKVRKTLSALPTPASDTTKN